MSSQSLHVQNSKNTSSSTQATQATQATHTGTFSGLTLSDIERQGFGGEGRHAYGLQPPAMQAFIAGCAEGALQADISLTVQNGEVEEAIHSAKHALLLRFVLAGESLTLEDERRRGFLIGLFDTIADFVADALESQQPAPAEAPQSCTCHSDGLPATNPATGGELTATVRAIDGYELGKFHLQSLRGLILGMRAAAGDAETVRHVADSADRLIDDFSHTNATELATLNTQLEALKAGAPVEPEALTLEKRLNAILGAGSHLQQYIESGDICVRYPAPSNAALPDPRRQAMEIFAAALAAVEGGT